MRTSTTAPIQTSWPAGISGVASRSPRCCATVGRVAGPSFRNSSTLTTPNSGSGTEAAETLFIGFSPESGLFEQFAGFFDLEEIDLSRYADRTVPLDVILGRERTQRSQVVKQADIVALLALLPEECDARARLANFQYYEPRCGHGSSLSRGMHALAAARLGEMDLATRYFQETAATDLADISDGSAGGVHIAALGGLWQAAVFGFGGLSLRAEALGLDPSLPPAWRTLGFHAHWRGRLVRITDRSGGRRDQCRSGHRRANASRSQRTAAHASAG